MAFCIAILITAAALAILRRRLIVAEAPAAPKGYLDHQADSAKASTVIARELNNITRITTKETKQIEAATARIASIQKLPHETRLQLGSTIPIWLVPGLEDGCRLIPLQRPHPYLECRLHRGPQRKRPLVELTGWK